jgi:uncharacterized membrane protein
MLAIVAVGYWSETTAIGRKLSGVIVVLALAMIASNLHLLPTSAPVYDTAWSVVVPIAIPLLLAKADLRAIFAKTGSLFVVFVLAGLGTVIGVLIASFAVDLGARESDIAGIFTATYIGGSVNFAAIAEALQVDDSAILTARVAADNVVGTLYLIVLAVLPGTHFLVRWYASRHSNDDADQDHGRSSAAVPLDPVHVASGLAYGCAVAFAGRALASWMSLSSYGLVFVTLIALVIATAFPRLMSKLRGEDVIGMILMYVFFAAVGAGADLFAVVNYGPTIFVFAALIVTVHFAFIMLVTRAMRLDVHEALVASNACIMGPATAAALAASQGWRQLVTPSIVCGSFGYAAANIIALLVANYLGSGG